MPDDKENKMGVSYGETSGFQAVNAEEMEKINGGIDPVTMAIAGAAIVYGFITLGTIIHNAVTK